MIEGTLVPSTNGGRYAVNSPDGVDLRSGDIIEIYLGGHWIMGAVEHTGQVYVIERYLLVRESPVAGYYFVAQDGSVCGLLVGMKVRVL